ncbi:MAG: TolC family protein [Limisphaerales bacterium]
MMSIGCPAGRKSIQRKFACHFSLFLVVFSGLPGAVGADVPEPVKLSLDACLLRVMEYNETIQIRDLEWRISQRKVNAERGIFEPEFVGSYQRQQNLKKTTAEQQSLSLATPILNEKNNLYDGGVEVLLPTGTKLRLGYTLQDLSNNLQQRFGLSKEYDTFAGVTFTQPLLKNGGVGPTMAAIRLAAGESEIAYQDYRRQMMLMLAQAESAYWDLYFFQEQYRIFGESVALAKTIMDDNKVRLQSGLSSELEVLEAESGLALRAARQNDAHHKLVDAMNRLTALFSGSGSYTNALVQAVDLPVLRDADMDFFSSVRDALTWNPDYLSQQRQVLQANIRLAYARNQRWPQIDLKASYGLNGLGETMSSSWADVQTSHFESWTVGVEMRIPLGGGVRGKNELAAAKLRKQQALLGLKSAEVQLSSGLDTAIKRTAGLRDSVGDFQKASDFNERLLDAELARLTVGKTDSRKVLETEEKLSEARIAVLEALVAYQKAFLEWELGKGTLLKTRKAELTQAQLTDRMLASLQAEHVTSRELERYETEAKTRYEKERLKLDASGSTDAVLRSDPAPTPARLNR